MLTQWKARCFEYPPKRNLQWTHLAAIPDNLRHQVRFHALHCVILPAYQATVFAFALSVMEIFILSSYGWRSGVVPQNAGAWITGWE